MTLPIRAKVLVHDFYDMTLSTDSNFFFSLESVESGAV